MTNGISFKIWRWKIIVNIIRNPDLLPVQVRKIVYEHFCGYDISLAAFLQLLAEPRSWLTNAVIYYTARNYPLEARELISKIALADNFVISPEGEVIRKQPFYFIRFVRLSELLPLLQDNIVYADTALAFFFQSSETYSDDETDRVEAVLRYYTRAQKLRLLEPIMQEYKEYRKLMQQIRPRKSKGKQRISSAKQDWYDILHLLAGEQVVQYEKVANLPAATVLLSLVKTANNLPND
ncbi:hypothetical protein [Rhodoflexus caldus]|uniref:hypothetical protein n=1 Tax=Rhodoflexus caldus TaxID=2891236 RepID=UPI00202A5030|nr:hypothetical protein [Rhodoflexus caldus]